MITVDCISVGIIPLKSATAPLTQDDSQKGKH